MRFNNNQAGRLGSARKAARKQWLDNIIADVKKQGITTRTLRHGSGQITVPDLTAFVTRNDLAITWQDDTCHIAKSKAA